jgi:hypothetical protein
MGRSSSPEGVKIVLYPTSSRPALGSTQSPIQWVPGLFHGGKVDHSPRPSADAKKMWIYTSTPPYAFMA